MRWRNRPNTSRQSRTWWQSGKAAERRGGSPELDIGPAVQLCGTFSGAAGVGLGAVRSYLDFAGARCSLFFFGFFASRPRLSRFPMSISSDGSGSYGVPNDDLIDQTISHGLLSRHDEVKFRGCSMVFQSDGFGEEQPVSRAAGCGICGAYEEGSAASHESSIFNWSCGGSTKATPIPICSCT